MIQTLGELCKVRQQVIATATIYFKRFYARNSLKNIDPLLMAPTCVFLASKVEVIIYDGKTNSSLVRKFMHGSVYFRNSVYFQTPD